MTARHAEPLTIAEADAVRIILERMEGAHRFPDVRFIVYHSGFVPGSAEDP
jgi:hypothetical protein